MRNNFKKLAKKAIPNRIISLRREYALKIDLFKAYKYDFYRFFEFSGINSRNSETRLIKDIITRYHIIEKGLTMPEARLGFGRETILLLCDLCIDYTFKYNTTDEQLLHAIGVVFEYLRFHEIRNYTLDKYVYNKIDQLKQIGINASCGSQITTSVNSYFSEVNSDFLAFSNSRKSVRNYSDTDVPLDLFTSVLELSKNSPSACNRQSWRTYLYTDKNQMASILQTQGGNRGFGHLANKLIIITGEVGAFGTTGERNQVFVDGGMYAMNLLYSLHYYQIAACILNCSTSVEKDLKLRKQSGIKDSEVFIAMISCGFPPEKFEIPVSKRFNIQRTSTIL